jgi:hypothetical protein
VCYGESRVRLEGGVWCDAIRVWDLQSYATLEPLAALIKIFDCVYHHNTEKKIQFYKVYI